MHSEVTPEIANPRFRAELLTRLGLPANAGPGHIEAAYRSAISMLERLPAEQQEWADGQRAEVDAIHSLLAEPSMSPAAAQGRPAAAGAAELPATPTNSGAGSHRRLVAAVAAGLIVVAAGAIGFNAMRASAVPGISGTPTNTASPSAAASVDLAKVAALMQKIAANPKDVTSLMGLADAYFQAGDYANSAHFSQEATTVAPRNDSAWVALGAAQFNADKPAAAKTAWLKAVAINPKNIEAHYDLGFYYLSGSSPDMARVKSEWEAVIAIDPNSDIAKNVKTHLASLAKATATATASPTASGK